MKEIYISLQMGPTFETFFFILKKKHLKQLSLINMSCVFGVVSHWEEGRALMLKKSWSIWHFCGTKLWGQY